MTRHDASVWQLLLVCAAALLLGPTIALGQDGGLLHQAPSEPTRDDLMLDNSSFLYQQPLPKIDTELRKNDIITVLVDIRSQMTSEGDVENRKRANLRAALTDWIAFDGKSIRKAEQKSGDPSIAGALTSQFRAEADMEAFDTMTFKIAAKIVDIRPNGNLVIEAHQTIRNNEEVWQQSLTGVVRRETIGADRAVKSEYIAELRIDKREVGQVRDGYNRGWFQKFYDRFKPI